jgi:hypothetical protein
MGVNTRNRIITDGLVLNLDAGNRQSYTSGNTDWRDLSGNNNNGTLTNGPTFSSENGGSIVLDGVDDYVVNTLLSTLSDDNSLTVNMFVNIDEPTKATKGGLLCNQRFQSESDAGGFGFVIESGGLIGVNLTKNISSVQTSYEVLSSFAMNRQQFALYTFTYNSNTKTVITYKNGVQQATTTNANYGWTKNTTNRLTHIGINTQGGWGAYYKMKISNVQIYNRVLTQQEITQNFNATRTRYGI